MIKLCVNKERCVHPDGPFLSREEFYKEKTKDGRRARCKACCREAGRQYEKDRFKPVWANKPE
jgi:hypothetical protein